MKKILIFIFFFLITKKTALNQYEMTRYVSESNSKIRELEAVIKELRNINIKVIEQLAQCKVNFNFSKMDIKNSGENPCFEQNMGFDFK